MLILKDVIVLSTGNYFRKSPTIQNIFKYTAEELQDPNKIKFDIENVDCKDLINDENMYVKKLFYISSNVIIKTYLLKKNVNWFRVICGLDSVR